MDWLTVPMSILIGRLHATITIYSSRRQQRIIAFIIQNVSYSSLCMYVCIFIKLHITAQSGPVILVILCHSH